LLSRSSFVPYAPLFRSLFTVGFGRREAAAQFPQHLLRPLFVALHGQAGGVPGLFALAVGTGIAEHHVVISVFLLQATCYHRHFSDRKSTRLNSSHVSIS